MDPRPKLASTAPSAQRSGAPTPPSRPLPADRPTTGEAPRPHGPWQIKSSQVAYSDPWVSVRRDEVIRPDGLDGSYAMICIKPGVCVVAVDSQGQVHLTEEFHYAVGRITIEGVSGGIEPGDTAIETAHRELREELGIVAQRLICLGTSDPFTASVQSPTALFVATGLTLGPPQPESTELIHPVVMPLAAAVEAVIAGTITHGPTCVMLLRMALDERFNQPG
jgi:ADP-ribose pyrophosphatase